VVASIEGFFPACTRAECARAGTPHADLLPHQRALLEATEKYVALVGGYGAGKTLPCAVLGVVLSLQVPGNRGLVIRRSYPKLRDSTQRVFLETLQRAGVPFETRESRDGWPNVVVLPNLAEIHFRESGRDLGRFLGPEYGWFFMDEAAEEPRQTWVALQGRLRLPQASRWLRGFLATNPPHQHHWIAEVFGLTPGTLTRTEATPDPVTTSYRLIRVSTRENPFLPPSYVADLVGVNPPSEVRRIVEGEYGFSYEGQPVYAPPFAPAVHTADLPVLPITVVRAWDFGYHAPAVTWHQFPRCKAQGLHWWIQHEFVGRQLESEQLATIVVGDASAARFPDHPRSLYTDCGDRAGAAVGEHGPGPITRLSRPPFSLRFKYRHLPNVDPGLALVRDALRTRCRCGKPVLQVHRACRHTLDMFSGGYHYPAAKPGAPVTREKPVKDGFYDNLADTVRYAGENYYRLLRADPRVLDTLMASNGHGSTLDGPPWSWMTGPERGLTLDEQRQLAPWLDTYQVRR
jgi:hypothetical protein